MLQYIIRQQRPESGKEAAQGHGIKGPQTPESKGEPEEAAAEIEVGGRPKEMAAAMTGMVVNLSQGLTFVAVRHDSIA